MKINEILLATSNKGKLEVMRELLEGLGIKIISLKDVFGDNIPEVEENGATLKENALLKATIYSKLSGRISVSDDAGIFIEALNGQPGIFTGRFSETQDDSGYLYSNELTVDENNRKKTLMLLQGTENRNAKFETVIIMAFPPSFNHDPIIVKDDCNGRITTEPRGNLVTWGFNPIFEVSGTGKTFAEMSSEERNKVSHRGKALRKLVVELEKLTNVVDKLNNIFEQNKAKRIVVVGTTCTGKTTILEQIRYAKDMDKLVFPTMTKEEEDYVCQDPWTEEIGKFMTRLVKERVTINLGEPVFGTAILDSDLVVYLKISDKTLKERTQKRKTNFENAKNMQAQIEREIIESRIPCVEVFID